MARGKGREGSGGFVLSSGAAKTASRNASFFAPDQAGISTSSGRRRETECVCEREREREGGGGGGERESRLAADSHLRLYHFPVWASSSCFVYW